jgi:hypothetical protein
MNALRLFFQDHRYAFGLSAVFVFGLLAYLNPAYFFTGDPLNKLIQTRSLLEFGFTSEELWYPARFIDPDFTFYPHPGVYIIQVGERYLGQYPLLFSILCAPFLYLFGPSSLGVVSAVLIVATLYSLRRFHQVRPAVLLFTVFCTPLVARGIEYAENIHVILLTFLGFSIYLKERRSLPSPGMMLLAGACLGVGVWLRHEVALFFLAFTLGLGVVFLLEEGLRPGSADWRRKVFDCMFREYFWFGLGFTVLTLAFFAFNYWDYGHILGPRFISNVEKFYKTLGARLRQTTTLLFFGPMVRLGPLVIPGKVGFFAFTPLFLAVFVLAALPRLYRRLGRDVQTVAWTLVFFIPLICYIAVSDGTVTWGPRYLILAILPAVLIVNRFAELRAEEGWMTGRAVTTTLWVLAVFSLVVNLVGLRFMRASTRQLEVVSQKFNEVPADLRLYQNPFLASHEGSDYFDNLTLLSRKQSELPLLFERLRAQVPGKTIVFFETNIPMDPVFDDVARPPWMSEYNRDEYVRTLDAGLVRLEERDLGVIRATLYRIPR